MTLEQMEAAIIAAMHEQTAPDGDDYTYDAPPELVRADEVAALRDENARLHMISERMGNEIITYGLANDDLRGRIAELEAQLAAVPVEDIADIIANLEPYPYIRRPYNKITKWLKAVQP